MQKHYAIFTFRSTGPIKSWSAMQAAQSKKQEPTQLIGSGRLVVNVKASLSEHGIDPNSLRKNGVIAYEAVLTASRGFFYQDGWDLQKRSKNLTAWAFAQKAFLLEKYGENRLASLVVHVDEYTPHIHAVLLPYQENVDQRRGDGVACWSLVGRSIAGPGEFQRLQSEYAQAMAPFGLSRGELGSGRKHKPVRDYMADIKARMTAADVERTKAVAERQEIARLRLQWLEQRQLLEKAVTRLQHVVGMVSRFAKEIRNTPAEQLTPAAVDPQGRAERVLEHMQRARLPEGTPDQALRQWAQWKRG